MSIDHETSEIEKDTRLPDTSKTDEGSKDGIDINDEERNLAEALVTIEQIMTPKDSETEYRALYQALASGKNKITVPHPRGHDGLAALSIQKLLTIIGSTAISSEEPGTDLNKFQALVAVNTSLRQAKQTFWNNAVTAVREGLNASGALTLDTLTEEQLILDALRKMMSSSSERIIGEARQKIAALKIRPKDKKTP